MTGLSIPGRSLLRLLFDLIVRLPDHQWDDLKDHFHGLIRDGQGDVGSIEELLRLINERRRHVASVRAAKAAEAAQNEGEG
ncbi:MAG: hypothetical protein OXN84_19250 [Albidovulum sp.]|nr:hypothetical protein [Albidovulum sp.]